MRNHLGRGSDHIREKDGSVGCRRYVGSQLRVPTIHLMVPVAWLNILAYANRKSPNKLVGVKDILLDHYEKYGRSFFSLGMTTRRVPSEGANKLVAALGKHIEEASLVNKKFEASTGESFTISKTFNFNYTDPGRQERLEEPRPDRSVL